MKRREYLVVDGHSVIFAWDELRRLHEHQPARARRELEQRLRHYQDVSETPVVLVFDGRGDQAMPEREEEGIQVIYSPRGRTADDFIERLVAKNAKRHEFTVVTNDHAEQETVRAFGALAIGAEGLLELMMKADRDFADRLRKHRRK